MYLDKPTPVLTKPVRCHWCGGMLARLTHLYKGKDSERHYDSEHCLKNGETRALLYAQAAARTVC